MTGRQVLAWLAGGGALYFAVQGGEYATTDLFRQRERERVLTTAIDSLRRDIDSLRTLKKRLEEDPVVQERVARELYGMVKGDHELVYRFTEAPPKP